MAVTPQFSDLTTIPTQAQILSQEVLPQLAAGNLSVTAWPVNGVYRTLANVIAFCRQNARSMLAALTAAGFEDYAFGRTAAPGGIDVTGWAPLVARQRYGLVQKPATVAQRTITLTNSSTTAYTNLQPGAIILAFPSGNRWVLNQIVTIPAAAGGVPSVTLATFRSEFTYTTSSTYNNDPSSSSIGFVTASFPGVVATNPAPTFSGVSQVGAGLGTVTPSGSPGSAHTVTVKIIASGTVGASTVGWATSLDGAGFVTQSGSSVSSLGGTGINIALTDNGGSFVINTLYYFSNPGTDLTQLGAAIETPQALGIRCAGLWPLLAFTTDAFGNFVPPASPTQSAYVALALSSNANVVIAFAVMDGTINNLVRIYVAGQGGAVLPSTVISSVAAFFSTFSMLTDQVLVASPAPRTISLAFSSGVITAKASLLASAQASLQQSLSTYLGGTDPVQPLGINGLVDYDYIISLIRRTPGVTKAPGGGALTINTVAADLQLPVTPGAFEVAQWQQTVIGASSCFTWATS